MRRAAKVDTTHAEIRDAFRKVGATVIDMARLGDGAPDLLVGWRGRTFLVECKSPNRKDGQHAPLERERLQEDLRNAWRGDDWLVVTSAEEAVIAVASAVASWAA